MFISSRLDRGCDGSRQRDQPGATVCDEGGPNFKDLTDLDGNAFDMVYLGLCFICLGSSQSGSFFAVIASYALGGAALAKVVNVIDSGQV